MESLPKKSSIQINQIYNFPIILKNETHKCHGYFKKVTCLYVSFVCEGLIKRRFDLQIKMVVHEHDNWTKIQKHEPVGYILTTISCLLLNICIQP